LLRQPFTVALCALGIKSMPLWVWAYIIVFLFLGIFGVLDDMSKSNKNIYVSGSVLSTIFGVVFVFSYYFESLANYVYPLFIPMLISGFVFEMYSAKRDLNEYDQKLTEHENTTYNLISMIGVNLITVPSYVFGGILVFRGIGT
jgi:hypothetical protein